MKGAKDFMLPSVFMFTDTASGTGGCPPPGPDCCVVATAAAAAIAFALVLTRTFLAGGPSFSSFLSIFSVFSFFCFLPPNFCNALIGP